MKKNVIFWIGMRDETLAEKYGDFEYFKYSIATWEHFCKRYDCHFVKFDEPVEKDLHTFRPNWQKNLFVFDVLESKGIEYDQICLVDSTCMYKWDAPNFFELTDRKFTAWRDEDNMKWIYDSIVGYKDLFDGYDLDQSQYINSGFMIFNETHRELFKTFKDFYYTNKDEFIKRQDITVRKGNDQTPLNYWLQTNNVDMNLDLSTAYKVTHLNRKDLFKGNWQLKEDTTPFFIKYCYNWIFNGIPKNERPQVMKQTWELVKHNYE